MLPINIHPPDPDNPKGMAFIMAAGFVDPRPGFNGQRQPMALIQSWEATSELWWDLGLRWHPELATKWLKGGGNFGVAEVTDEPQDYTPSVEKAAEEVLEYLAKENPQQAELLKRIRSAGTPEERAEVAKTIEKDVQALLSLMKYVTGEDK
ncbi:minor tail protein [Mycobacterium phage Kumao]|uniref:Minor tail protein n=1 Tax=Mycobacterium phage Kumao TaxID=2041344 RepID=A0A2D1GPM4_9CAUD|nr:minor tail protein [Mycobacterium phage Kumao]ATN93992.1 minor tail protein [Mycobacterium phage Kumao]